MNVFKLIASAVYASLVFVRNTLFDERILCSYSPSVPTICIGNLAMGGTGKTPHTEYLVSELAKYFRVAILSRGYKRKTHGFVLADDNASALTIGDEPFQMHKKMPNVVLAVCESRVQGVKRLRQMYSDLQVIVLDDAFQHRKIQCGFNILLTSADNLYVNDHFFPLGKLRDSRHSSLRANMVVVSKCNPQMQPIERRMIETSLRLPPYQQIFFSYLKYGEECSLEQWKTGVSAPTEHQHHAPLLLTAIENPQPMYDYLKLKYPNLSVLTFPDHHQFTKADLQLISNTFEQNHCDSVITTEKDAARLLSTPLFPEHLLACTFLLPVMIDFKDSAQSFLRPILQYVQENNRNTKNTLKTT